VTAPRSAQRALLGPLLFLMVLVAVVLALRSAGLADIFSREHIDQLQAYVLSWGAWAPLLYVLLCIVAVVLLAPATPLLFLAGVFGAAWGTVYATAGLTLGVSASFLLARYLFRPSVERLLQGNPMMKRIDEGVVREGWRIVMITRLIPIFPFNLQNYAYGLTKIRFVVYALVSLCCMLPYIAAYVFVGGSLISGRGDIRKTVIYLTVGGVLVVLLTLLPRLLKKRFADEVPSVE
jgi:uncharacterized membrane protein YdjX (TVP38/TMEM64 family)